MKKGISVLLVAAALFGFYGGAVNLNDILACKDYWEEAGEKSTADMNKLEDGLNQLKDNEQAYLDGLDQVAEGEKELAQGEADYAAAPGKLAAGEKKLAAGKSAYAAGQKELAAGKATLAKGKKTLAELKKNLELLRTGFNTWDAGWQAANEPQEDLGGYSAVQAFHLEEGGRIRTANVENNAIPAVLQQAADQGNEMLGALPFNPTQKAQLIAALNLTVPETKDSIRGDLKTLVDAAKYSGEDPQKAGLAAMLAQYKSTLEAKQTKLETSLAKMEAMKGLEPGRDTLAANLNKLLAAVTADEENLKAMGGKAALEQVKQGLSGEVPDSVFDSTVKGIFTKADELVKKSEAKIAKGEKDLKAGKKKLAAGARALAAGKAELAQGYADYEAAPAKLADGRAQLAAGKDKLAQYEDGEQQVRDGLATLVGTEADLDLESILDRLNGDSDFDNGDNHLELDEGLAAVDVGRGYQAEDGELITKEIMTRAIGTGGLLAAGVLAVLAAILSFMKKNKGAGVLAILSAVAGAFGAYEATQTGTYFSSIAGSTVGQTGMIAAGILAAVALVHSIAHFTAKKEA